MDAKPLNILLRSMAVLMLLSLLTGAIPGSVFPASAAPGETTRVSVDSSGAQGNGGSASAAVSADGRFVAFKSGASNLVSGDTNGAEDIFVRDRQTGATTRVSVDSSSGQANEGSEGPVISNDGRFVAFASYASNLVIGDTNRMVDIFAHDRQTGVTTRVSVNSSGNEANGETGEDSVDMSGDGRYVTFSSEASNLVTGDTNGASDIFVHDRQSGQTTRISVDSSGAQANSGAGAPAISNDGRYVVFSSGATNLVANDTNGKGDVLVHDRQTGATTRVSVNSSGAQADGGGSSPDISGDGRYVVFISKSDNLAPGTEDYDALVYVHDRQTGQTTLASAYSDGGIMTVGIVEQPTISSNGRYVAFSFYDKGNNNGILNIWARDLQMGSSVEVAHGTDSSYGSSLSSDGSVVAFWSLASNLVSGDTNGARDVFVHEVNYGPERSPTVASVAPQCGSFAPLCPYPTPAGVSFIVVFSEYVSGVTMDDFILSATGEIYTVAKNTPNVPNVTGSLRAGPNPASSADLISFTVSFSEAVSGVDAGDFSLSTSGGLSGALVTNVGGSGNIYTVLVATGSGDGGLRLDILDDDSILNASGIPLGGAGAGNGGFTTGEAYTVDKTVPIVTGSLRADPNPTAAASVNFTVVFSESVTGVDPSVFSLSTNGTISGATVTGVNGSGYLYTVSVGAGSGDGTLRLDVVDNDSILDVAGLPLAGTGVGNGNFTTGEEYLIARTPVNKITESIRSNGANDGWVLESNEGSNQGGSRDSSGSTFVLGDDAQDRQFRAILHFPTQYLPDNAVVTRALLMVKGEGLVGENPFATHQNILVDIRSGAFGFIGPFPYRGLQVSDFQSPSHKDTVGMIANNPLNGWYWTWLDSSAFEYINLNGSTQFRLRFQHDDNDDLGNDYLRFYSGDYGELADRPRLVVEYYIPR